MLAVHALWVAAAALALVALTLGLLAYLGTIRIPLVMDGKVRLRDVALSREAWPELEKKVSNAVDNQFQLPVLFYLVAGFSIVMDAGVLEAILAWAFVVSRYVHAMIFITTNNVLHRFVAYSVGYLILSAFWLLLAIRLIAVVAVAVAFGSH